MTPEELRSQGPPTTLDNTLRSMYRGCPRKDYWFLRGYDYKEGTKPAYFIFGSAFTEMQDYWYKNLGDDEGALKAGKEYWEIHIEGKETFKPDNLETLEGLWKLYIERYPSEPWNLIAGEVGWRFPIGERDGRILWYGGSMDGYVEWPGYGFLVLENKTTGGWLSRPYLAQWAYSPQVTGYIWGLTQLKGEEIFGCLMNLSCKNLPGPRAKRTTAQFARPLEQRSTVALEEFEAEVIDDFRLISEEWDRWIWKKTIDPGECVGRPGRSACLFRYICRTPIPFEEIDPLTFQGIKLRKGVWEPWKRRGEQT
ncbi:hypothetical protein LCGC14_0739430 [marine sediment metagenome]|uniref:PD-(D/E)XK endonuclease-like domain-containing protein n=1 Tax=marine sediment metagenome TaxID=412755 RepID=A0A0F9SS28_9ZZZZ